MGVCLLQKDRIVELEDGRQLEVRYHLTSGRVRIDGQEVVTYGITLSSRCGDAWEESAAADISSNRPWVEALLERLWRLEVTPVTLRDIVMDSIEN